MNKMYLNIRDSLIEKMLASDWTSQNTTEAAAEKITEVTAMIGYPKFLESTRFKVKQNLTSVDRYFDDVVIDPGRHDDDDVTAMMTYMGNVEKLMMNERKRDLERLYKPTDRLL